MRRTSFPMGIAMGALLAATAAAQAPLSNAITYQGELKNGPATSNGLHDMRFRLYDASGGGAQVGSTVCVDGINVVDGLFTTSLDFGASVFDGNARWLQIDVRADATGGNCSAGVYTALSPRQALTMVPYAAYALDGPGQPGYWAANGTAIYNTNTGRVGIGTTNPGRVLHTVGDAVMFERAVNDAAVFLRNTVNGTLNSVFGLKNTSASAGYSYLTDAAQAETLVLRNGNVGIGTNTPTAKLQVAAALGQWGLRVYNDSQNSAIYGSSDGGTAPAVYAVSSSTSASAVALHGLIASATPGDDCVGVRGTISSSSSTSGYGVYGKHGGSGRGVFGESLSTTAGQGVYGSGWWGVYGVANTDTGYGGVFAGSGFLGGGQALLVWGESHLSTTGIGTTSPQAILHVNSSSDSSPSGGGIVVIGNTAAGNISIDGNEIMARNNGAVSPFYINHNGGDVNIGQASGGTVVLRTPVLEITGGADLSENFDVATNGDSIAQPGTVVCIDPANPGKLIISKTAYDRTVAGVISGAGGVKPGMLMGQHGTVANGSQPVALSGRVFVRCDASTGPIQPGDLLTTSHNPGHAMKVTDHSRAHGAIIGKAMSALEQGQGEVLVLISLQ